jgi:hypothetical protein
MDDLPQSRYQPAVRQERPESGLNSRLRSWRWHGNIPSSWAGTRCVSRDSGSEFFGRLYGSG